MTALNKQELQIIEAFSSVNISESIICDSNIRELIYGLTADQKVAGTNAHRLEQLRREKQEGNFLGNWWVDLDDKIQDAQIDLNKTIGRLTQKSSQLLIINTVISKALSDQQRILLQQQDILKQQTDTLKEQNNKILEQQSLLEKQQRDINQANQGLLEASGMTQEQAKQLVGCVKLAKEVESNISATNQILRSAVEQSLHDSVERCLGRLHNGFAEQKQRYDAFEQQVNSGFSAQVQRTQEALEQITAESAQLKSALQEQLASAIAALRQHSEAFKKQLTTAFSTQSKHAQGELAHFASNTNEFKVDIGQQLQVHIQTVLEKNVSIQDAIAQQLHEVVKSIEHKQETTLNQHTHVLKASKAQLAALQAEQQKGARSSRLAIAIVAAIALLSLSWQAAQHFALV